MSGHETKPLLVEIGCEEIPARFLQDAAESFRKLLWTAVEDSGLLPDGQNQPVTTPVCFRTSRRLMVFLETVRSRQLDPNETVQGPSVKAAYDATGRPTRAAESFATKNGKTVGDLFRVQTTKGEYVALLKVTPGRSAEDLLAEILPRVITGMEFPKSMIWPGKQGMRFVRPIRWIVAIFGEVAEARIIRFSPALAKPFEIAGVAVGNKTFGHRFLSKEAGPITVSSFDDYARQLRENFVEIDPAARLEQVRQGIKQLLEVEALKLVEDCELERWIVDSTEWPSPIMGSFDRRFLSLPREILITVMRDHQKYFAIEDKAGNLQPSFITVLNMDGDPKGLIRHGHERVLTARFRDAEFFWQADQKIPLRDRLPILDRVTYQKDLGSYGNKIKRMRAIASELCQTLEGQGRMSSQETSYALRAIDLCKCDLTAQMVQEFPELQGIVGGLYAKAQGEPKEASEAIYDHYRPLGLEDRNPRSPVGAVVSLADKLDAIIAGFSAGLEPTGSSDPFGLRRAGNGIVKISVEVLPGLNLHHLAERVSVMNFGLPAANDLWSRVAKFLRERVEYYLSTVAGLRYDTVRAIVQMLQGGGWSIPSKSLQLGKALERVRDREEFLSLSQAARRTRNILKKSATLQDFGSTIKVNEGLLTAGPERELYVAYQEIRRDLATVQAQDGYEGALLALGRLRPYVDRFFDSVLVMDNNLEIRSNRLRLLSELNTFVFTGVADLSEIVVAPNVDASTSKAAPEKS